jgi:hypothetical protein
VARIRSCGRRVRQISIQSSSECTKTVRGRQAPREVPCHRACGSKFSRRLRQVPCRLCFNVGGSHNGGQILDLDVNGACQSTIPGPVKHSWLDCTVVFGRESTTDLKKMSIRSFGRPI